MSWGALLRLVVPVVVGLALVAFAADRWWSDLGRQRSAPEPFDIEDLPSHGPDRWIALRGAVWRCDDAVPPHTARGFDPDQHLYRLEADRDLGIWALATPDQCRASSGVIEGYVSFRSRTEQLRRLEARRDVAAPEVALLRVGRTPTDVLVESILLALLGIGLVVGAIVVDAVARGRGIPRRPLERRAVRDAAFLWLAGLFFLLVPAALAYALATSGHLLRAAMVVVGTAFFAARVVASCLVQGSVRLDETGVRWRSGLARHHVPWAEVVSWYRGTDFVEIETTRGRLAILEWLGAMAHAVDQLEGFVPERENALREPRGPLRPRRAALVATGALWIAMSMLASAAVWAAALVFVPATIIYLAYLTMQSVMRIDERGIVRWHGTRPELVAWSEVRGWSESSSGFRVESAHGDLHIDPAHWPSRAEIRAVLRAHAGSPRDE